MNSGRLWFVNSLRGASERMQLGRCLETICIWRGFRLLLEEEEEEGEEEDEEEDEEEEEEEEEEETFANLEKTEDC